jgi:regulator of sigma E protease
MELSEALRYLQVALGIGLVIFVHEAGHFIAARVCKVRVETFSLGFGPRLIGWKRGATLYQIAMVPLGGYVKMRGEEVGDRAPLSEDDLRSKSVGQRFFIYSGGVLMNVVFGLVVFPIVLAAGVPFSEPVIGEVLPGGPAWVAGLEPGSRVLSVENEPSYSFDSILSEVALRSEDEVRLRIIPPPPSAGAPREVLVRPKYNERLGLRMIDVAPALDPENRLHVKKDSPAAFAGIVDGERLVGVEGAIPGVDLPHAMLELMERGTPVVLEIEGAGGPGGPPGERRKVELRPERVEVQKSSGLGISPAAQRVRAVRNLPLPGNASIQAQDRLVAVEDATIVSQADLRRELLERAEAAVTLHVVREGRDLELHLPPLGRDGALQLASDVALEADMSSTVVCVQPECPAFLAGLRDGDRITRIADTPVSIWTEVQEATKRYAKHGETLAVQVQRRGASGALEYFDLIAHPSPLTQPEYGLELRTATYVYQASGPAEAIRIGFESAWKFLRDGWNTLKSIVLGHVSGENLGGIITIGKISYDWAEVGLSKLFFFLCMLSINLAFLNVLPIPVLDGGHLFFLLVEKLKGSPVSDRVLGYSQMVGLVLILSLMIYVTFNDIRRIWLP